MTNNNLVKIFFEWEENGELFSESMWAEGINSSAFRLDNVPLHMFGISCGDVFEAEISDNSYQFKNIIEKSGHSTLRIAFLNQSEQDIQKYFSEIQSIGGFIERFSDSYIGIDVTPEVNIEKIINYCEKGEQEGLWEYEQADINKNKILS